MALMRERLHAPLARWYLAERGRLNFRAGVNK
jgi:hypothetical protein